MDDKALNNAELELTQKIQMHFPRGVISGETLRKWNGCPIEVLSARLTETFSQFPVEAQVSAPAPEVPVDSIIRVDRSIRPSYPDWAKRVEHPDLEPTGSSEYDITTVKQWLHDGQKDGKWIEGSKIYAHLKETDTLKTCLGLRDLEEIQKKGIAFFRKHFQGKAVFAWKSVVLHRDDDLHVPFLYELGGEVVMDWDWLVNDWRGSYPALRFAS